jgi:hypothetical protein
VDGDLLRHGQQRTEMTTIVILMVNVTTDQNQPIMNAATFMGE